MTKPSQKTYQLNVAGLTRELPIVAINDSLSIASFVILGDTELVRRSAEQLATKLPAVDILVTAEAKGIPLIYELAKILDMPRYVVARKSVKGYMSQPLVHQVKSITTKDTQTICLDGPDVARLRGKRVALIDDVISTGGSLKALEALIDKADGKVVAKAAILAEGEAMKRDDIIYLAELPLFQADS